MFRILAVSVACLTLLVSMLGDPSRPVTSVAIPLQRVVISAPTGPGNLGQVDGQRAQAARTESANGSPTAATVAPTATAVPVVPTATTIPASPTPTAVPAPPTATAVPTADATWAALQPELGAAWGNDTPRTIEILDGFLAGFPDYEPARDKLYAALVTRGGELAASGDATLASEAFLRARDLQPNRAEAVDGLLVLTPTPVPPTNTPVPPAAPAVRQLQPTPRPAAPPVRVVPPPAPRQPVAPQPVAPAPQAPAPTPTKVPFSVPRAG